MGKHMPEPWSIKLDRPAGTPASANERPLDALIMSSGRYICRCRDFMGEDPTNIADAKRIVACVNACEGITTEALQSGAVEIMVDMSLAYVNDDILARNARNGTNCALLTGQTYFIDKVKVLEEEIL